MSENTNFGTHGKALFIDLTSKTFEYRSLQRKLYEQFIGGRGLGAALLYQLLPAGADPLGPENLLIFTTGPLTATTTPGSSRYCLTTKSPLTNIYLYSIAGGYFGPEMKRTGVDAIVISGRAENPTYLFISADGVEFRDASSLWGMTTDHAQEFICKDQKGSSVRIACIGPAGENLVSYACVMNERRAAGRGGAGAVLGSKNLKGVAVKGRNKTNLFDEKAFRQSIKKANKEILSLDLLSKTFRKYGSASMVEVMNEAEIMPIRNFQVFRSDKIEQITSGHFRENYVIRDVLCAGPCPVRCSKVTLVPDGHLAGELTDGPEYETIYAFGSCCDIYDAPTIIAADSFCDRYGLDTMSAGVSIAFAMECFEKGMINSETTDDVQLDFGRADLILPLLHKIAYRQGFGDFLAKGTREMARQIGQGSGEFAMHVKGLELGGYDPRGAKGMGAVYAFGPRGGCHHAGGYTAIAEVVSGQFDRFAEEGKAKLAIASRNRRSAAHDSGGICAFVGIGISDETTADLLNQASGIPYRAEDIYQVGERIACVERAFSAREGLVPSMDTLPPRLLNEAAPDGPNQGQIVDIEVLTKEFYEASKWDSKTGLPQNERVNELEIDWLLGK